MVWYVDEDLYIGKSLLYIDFEPHNCKRQADRWYNRNLALLTEQKNNNRLTSLKFTAEVREKGSHNISTWRAEAGGLPWALGQPWPHSELQPKSYTRETFFEKKQKQSKQTNEQTKPSNMRQTDV